MRSLTAYQVIQITTPQGMTAASWAEFLHEAYEAQAVWVDPWSEGSNDWESFTNPEKATVKHVDSAAIAVDRTTFRRLVAQHVPKGRPGSVCVQALAFAVADHAHDDGSQCFPSAEILAAKLGNSRARVSNARTKLIGDGWLRATGDRQGRANVYQLSVPAHLIAGTAEASTAA